MPTSNYISCRCITILFEVTKYPHERPSLEQHFVILVINRPLLDLFDYPLISIDAQMERRVKSVLQGPLSVPR